MDPKDSDNSQPGALSPEEYQRMDEKEKDAAITRSIIRLQSKIRTILYLAETEKARKANNVGQETKNKSTLEKKE